MPRKSKKINLDLTFSKSKKRINICQRGKEGERGLAELLREFGFKSARRSQQFSGKGDGAKSDVVAPDELPDVHFENKMTKSPNLERSKLAKWVEQISTDCPAHMLPVVFTRADKGDYIAIVRLRDFIHLPVEQLSLLVCTEESFHVGKWLSQMEQTERIFSCINPQATAQFKTTSHFVAYEVNEGNILFGCRANIMCRALAAWQATKIQVEINQHIQDTSEKVLTESPIKIDEIPAPELQQ